MKPVIRYEVLEFKPELTHSVWIHMVSNKRSHEARVKELRMLVKSGTYVGYRVVTVHEEHIGVSWK